ncbi:MAG: cyclodeaminase/cyclohydrolase family protein [Candidatus Omnitrophica bacterium]|nr:cyclodeaminase/cyclohydrolase family protein [Candidatus Omnitrophota bacterium]
MNSITRRLRDHTVEDAIRALSAGTPAPGGGSAAAIVAAVGIALTGMMAEFTKNNPRYAPVRAQVHNLLRENKKLSRRSLRLMESDARVFLRLNEVFRLPRSDPRRKRLLQQRLRQAAAVPAEVCAVCAAAAEICCATARIGNRHLLSDAGCAIEFLLSAARAAGLNVAVNARLIDDRRLATAQRRLTENAVRRIEADRKIILRLMNTHGSSTS